MITLWSCSNSAGVKKVLWTFGELELLYSQILAGGQHGGDRDADYLALSPNGLVPLLHDGEVDVVLWGSNAIVRYLTVQYGQKRLWTDAPTTHVVGEEWMDWANQTLNPAYRAISFDLARTPADQRDITAIGVSKQVCDNPSATLDDALTDQPWFSGAEFGTADITVALLTYNLFNVGLSWTPRPHLERWYQQLTKRPTFQKTVMIPVN